MIKVDEAREIILKNIRQLDEETVCLRDSLGRTLGESIYAEFNMPFITNSQMDGYAIVASSTAGAAADEPKILDVIDDVPAGCTSKKIVKSGQAVRIMTGAPIPRGADSVIALEDTEKIDSQEYDEEIIERIKIFDRVKKGDYIRYRGADVKKGELVIEKGKVIRPQEICMLAALNVAEFKVIKRPRVSVVSTGNELIDIGQKPGSCRVINSSSHGLVAQILKSGGIPQDIGIAKDNRDKICKKIETAITDSAYEKGWRADALVITGGVSVGHHDIVKYALAKMGMKTKFWRVAMKPGKPFLFGMIAPRTSSGRQKYRLIPVFGLPGNPASTMICFDRFVAPALKKMQGIRDYHHTRIIATMKEDFRKEQSRYGQMFFVRVEIEKKKNRYYASLSGVQNSGFIKTSVNADGVAIIPEDKNYVKAGNRVEVELFD